jgi:hypothetical protein
MLIGSLRLHRMAFNWQRPASVAAENADCVSQVEQAKPSWDLTEREGDLEPQRDDAGEVDASDSLAVRPALPAIHRIGLA